MVMIWRCRVPSHHSVVLIIHTFAFLVKSLTAQKQCKKSLKPALSLFKTLFFSFRIRKEEEELERWRKEREQAKKARQAEKARKGEIQGQTSLPPTIENQKQLSSEQVAEVDSDKNDGKKVEPRAPSETTTPPPTMSTDQQPNHQVDLIKREQVQISYYL